MAAKVEMGQGGMAVREPRPGDTARDGARRALAFEVHVAAARETVWRRMLDDAGYRQWTAAFCAGSHYRGRWDVGSEIDFLDPDGNGLRARVVAHWPAEVVALRHLAGLRDGQPCRATGDVDWCGCGEDYLFGDVPGGTRLRIEATVPAAHAALMEDLWPRALAALKALCEAPSRPAR